MSDRLTRVSPRERLELGNRAVTGLAHHGHHTRPEMINKFRDYWQGQLELAQAALALTDDELIVETYLGPWAMKNRKEVTS